MDGVDGQDSLFHRSLSEKWRRITHGEGVYLFDSEGRSYLDACAGVHVVSIGHGVPEIADAMRDQARKVSFTYSRFLSQPQLDLAEKIVEMAPEGLSRVFFISGGSEATESALKMARKYHIETGNPRRSTRSSRAGKAGTAIRLVLSPCQDGHPGARTTSPTFWIAPISRHPTATDVPTIRLILNANWPVLLIWSA